MVAVDRHYIVSLTASGDSKGPPFFFAGRPVHRPHYTVFHRCSQHSPSGQDFQPLVGYLDYLNVTGFRVKNKGYSTVGTRPFAKGSSQAAPNEWTDDPYFMCVLLSIAQLQEHLLKNSSPRSHMVCSLVELCLFLLVVHMRPGLTHISRAFL
jgi:hypothetical protein